MATSSSGVGTYSITQGTLANANYTITFAQGTLTVSPAPLTVTAQNQSKVYGTALPALTYTTSAFAVSGDRLSGTLATLATSSSSVGTYNITQGTLANLNYSITFTQGTLTVTPAPLTINANSVSRVYGQPNPTFTASYTGLVNGDTSSALSGTLTFSTGAITASQVGSYIIYLRGQSSNNYTIGYTTGIVTVIPALLTVSVNSASKVYGQANPTFTATYTGLVNGDTTIVLSGTLTFSTSASTTSPVGNYFVSATGLSGNNYSITFQNGTLTVTPALLTVSVNNAGKVYGQSNPAFSVSYSGFVNGDTTSVLAGSLSFSTSATTISPMGSYSVQATGLSGSNYSITFQNGTLTVTQAPLTVTVQDSHKVYGQPNPTFSVSYSGFVNEDTATALGGTLTFSTGATPFSSVGSYLVFASGLTSGNYTISYVSANLAVTPAPLTISPNPASTVYGQPNPTFSASYTGLVNNDTASALSGTLVFSTTATATSPVGTYPVSVSGLSSSNYTITYSNSTLTVSTALLTVTVNNTSKVYGQPNPIFTASYTGLVNGDTLSALSGTLTFSTQDAASSPAGSYTVQGSGLTDSNYTIAYVNGTLTVSPAPLTVTVNNASMVYGQPYPAFSASYTGLVNGDTQAQLNGSLTFSPDATAGAPVGSYAVQASGLSSSNYTITYTDGTLTVIPAPLTVNVNPVSIVYGESNPAFSASFTGLVNGDTPAQLGGSLIFSTASPEVPSVGTYAVYATGLSSTNYTITYVNGILTVTPAPLTVAVDAASKFYGQPNPDFSVSYAGFVNGDTPSVLSGTLAFSTNADTTSPAGSYLIQASGLTGSNYALIYQDGTFTVTPAPLTIGVNFSSKIYGQPNPDFSVSYAGLVNGDTPSDLSGTLVFSTDATDSSPPGAYSVQASGLSSPNYSITYCDGTLDVVPADPSDLPPLGTLTITVNAASKVYGQPNPTFSVSYAGFVNGDTPSVLFGQLVLTTDATTSSPVGSYDVSASGLSSLSYTIVYVDGSLTVTPAPLTVAVDVSSKVYGQANPAFSANYSGLVNGDTLSALSGILVFSTTATAASPVGSYDVSAGGLSDSNYLITYSDSTLTISPALLTITANSVSQVYGQPGPTLSASYSGLVNNDTPAQLGGTLSLSTAANSGSAVGSYEIYASGLWSNNYAISFVDGDLTVTPAPLTITVNDASQVYGQPIPSFSVTYAGLVNGDTSSALSGVLTFTTSATDGSPAGSYPIQASGLWSNNYTISYADGALTVTPAPLTITVDCASKLYGQPNPSFSVSYAGLVNGDTPSALSGVLAFTTSATESSPVANYHVCASGLSSSNYTIAFVDGDLTVTPAALTIAVNAASQLYGQPNPGFSVSYAGLVNSDTPSDLSGSLSFTTSATNSSPVGSYSIQAGGLSSSNYTITYQEGILAVMPDPLTVIVQTTSRLYGQVNPAFSAIYTGFINGDTVRSLSGELIFSTGATSASPVGNYTVYAAGLQDTNYTISYVNGVLSVAPAPLTVSVNSASKIYGRSNPNYGVSYIGFVNGDTSAALAGSLTFSTSATAASPVGSYSVQVIGLTGNNYAISYTAGTLTVTPAPLTVSVNSTSKVYGQANPAFGVSYTGLVNGDTSSVLSGTLVFSTSASASSPVGSYAVQVSGLSGSNYTITYANGTLTVTPAALTVNVINSTIIYGQAIPSFGANFGSFVNGDSQTSLGGSLTFSTGAITGSPVGNYTVYVTGLTSSNYTISYTNGTLTINPAPLTVSVNSASKVYGQANPTFTATISGFVNGDTSSILGGTLSYSTTATTGSSVGSYFVNANGLTASNYTIRYVTGTLTVTPASLTVTVANTSKVYGSANPSFSVTYSGFQNGDTASSLTGTLTYSTSAGSSSPVGSYPVSAVRTHESQLFDLVCRWNPYR